MSGIDKVDTGSPLLPPIAVIGTPSSPPHVITPSHQNVISNKSGLNHHPNGHSSHTGPSGTSDVILSNGTTHMSAMTCDHLLSPEVNANDLAVVTRCPAEPSVMASFPDDPQYLNMPDVHLGKDYSCGLCSLRPKWLQRLANKQSFLTIFCLTSVLQGMYYTYFVSVLTTIEKLYQIQSKTTGIIMSATEIGQIGGALLLTYYGGQGHRPKWISCGMLIFALASIFCSTPHYLFGGPASLSSSSSSPLSSLSSPPPISSFTSGDPFETGDEESEESSHPHFQIRRFSEKLCHSYNRSRIENLDHRPSESFDTLTSDHKEGRLFSSYDDVSSSSHKSVSRCDDPELSSSQSRVKYTVLTIFFMSLFLIGIGATAVNTLGIPYIDDNVAPRESPLYFGITIGVRIFGPVFGFLLGSICTSIYVGFPFGVNPGLSPSDPQWIGAWWLGVFIVGTALSITSVFMMAFPKKLPQPDPSSYCHQQQQNSMKEQQLLVSSHKTPLSKSEKEEALVKWNEAQEKKSNPSLKDFPTAVKRLLKNDILLCRTASSVLHILPIAGLYTFLPKYLESQFQLTASRANMISGIAGILVMGVGIFASGIFMRKYKPSPRFVALWIALAALLYAFGMVILMFLGCPLNQVVGLNAETAGIPFSNNTQETCGTACSCQKGEYSPICTSEGITYISACLAGCSKVSSSSNSSFIFSDCKCLGPNVTAVNGNCELNCDNLIWYIIIFSFFVLIHSTSEVGSMLLTLRCVDPQDKAMALGLISFAIGLFGNVPCPILYGAVVDSACLFWEHSCGQLGACRVYDPSKFRTVFHGVTAIIMFIAFLVDAVVWYKASSIKFLQDEEETGDPHQPVSHDSNPIKSPSHDSNVNSLQLKTNDESVV